jgi:hypothetical protein
VVALGVLALSVAAVLAGPGAAPSARDRARQAVADRAADPTRTVLRPKVLLITYDPILESEGGKQLSAYCGWNDSATLAEGYISDLKKASGGYLQYQIARKVTVDQYPLKKDGFRYDDASYLRCYRKQEDWHQPDAVDYGALFRDFKVEDEVQKRRIDEVWVFSMPYSGYWESTMAGKGAYFCNSDPVPGVRTSRAFVTMGFNYERGVGEMLEDFGHRTESIMTHVYGSWEAKKTHAWNRFTLYDRAMPGEAACGNVHFAPNSTKDYEWGNPRPVESTCDDWLNYPRLTGKKRTVTDTEWGSGDIRKHHVWWLSHLPKAAGRTDGKLNNWWAYVADLNAFPESR